MHSKCLENDTQIWHTQRFQCLNSFYVMNTIRLYSRVSRVSNHPLLFIRSSVSVISHYSIQSHPSCLPSSWGPLAICHELWDSSRTRRGVCSSTVNLCTRQFKSDSVGAWENDWGHCSPYLDTPLTGLKSPVNYRRLLSSRLTGCTRSLTVRTGVIVTPGGKTHETDGWTEGFPWKS